MCFATRDARVARTAASAAPCPCRSRSPRRRSRAYGMPNISSMPCSVPSSPFTPCTSGKTASTLRSSSSTSLRSQQRRHVARHRGSGTARSRRLSCVCDLLRRQPAAVARHAERHRLEARPGPPRAARPSPRRRRPRAPTERPPKTTPSRMLRRSFEALAHQLHLVLQLDAELLAHARAAPRASAPRRRPRALRRGSR